MTQLLVDWQQVGNETLNILKTVGIKIAEVIGIFVLGFITIKVILNVLQKIFEKSKMPKVTYKFLMSVLKFGLYLLLLVAICQVVGIPITGFVAVISAAGLALSLAMQGSLSNLANGVVIISTRPFNEGDYISIGDVEGTVVEIKMLHTIINTVDNKTISIPNSKVVESELTNYSKNPTRKVLFSFGVDYATDVEKAKEIILKVMKSSNRVLLDPAPFCALKKLDASCITFNANCWCYTQDYWDVYYYVMDNVFNEFKRNDISVPFDQMEVRLREDNVVLPYNKKPLQKRDEKIAVQPPKKEEDALEKIIKTFTRKKKTTDNKNKKKNAKVDTKKQDKKSSEIKPEIKKNLKTNEPVKASSKQEEKEKKVEPKKEIKASQKPTKKVEQKQETKKAVKTEITPSQKKTVKTKK